jgi:hypothetical protein
MVIRNPKTGVAERHIEIHNYESNFSTKLQTAWLAMETAAYEIGYYIFYDDDLSYFSQTPPWES